MTFYHGTTRENWLKILEEGVLHGRIYVTNNGNTTEVGRCTYLAVEPEEANNYGDVLLRVEYDPYKEEASCNGFDDTCWQLRVYEPISIENVREIKLKDIKPLYIRFGEIPEEGFSTIYKHGEEIGKEKGISAYRCLIDDNDVMHLCFPLPTTQSRMNTFEALKYYDAREAYLITGDFIGYGSEGECLLENVRIAKRLGKSYYKKEE